MLSHDNLHNLSSVKVDTVNFGKEQSNQEKK